VKKYLETKLHKFSHIYGAIRTASNKKIRKEIQIKFYKTVATPTLTYSSKTWTLKKKQGHKIEIAELKFLRTVAGSTLKDQIGNTVTNKE
jgi:cyclopropane fatty-acyl-phospholipid synthase-like methyltransferase